MNQTACRLNSFYPAAGCPYITDLAFLPRDAL